MITSLIGLALSHAFGFVATPVLAWYKGRSVVEGFVLGLFMGCVGLFIELVLPGGTRRNLP